MSLIFYNLLRKHLSTKMIFDNIFKPAKKDQTIEQDGRLKVVLNNQKKGTICTRIKNAIQIISTIVSSSEKLIMLRKKTVPIWEKFISNICSQKIKTFVSILMTTKSLVMYSILGLGFFIYSYQKN